MPGGHGALPPTGSPIPSIPGMGIQGGLSLSVISPLSSQAKMQQGPGSPSCFGSWKTQSKPYQRLVPTEKGPILHSHTQLMLASNSGFKQPTPEPPPKLPAADSPVLPQAHHNF